MSSSTTHSSTVPLRPPQDGTISRPRAVYSIDQILGTQNRHSGKSYLSKIIWIRILFIVVVYLYN